MQRTLTLTAILAAAAILTGCATREPEKKSARPMVETLSGVAYAINGKRLVINGRTVELWGINVPTMRSPSGWYARDALDDFIGKKGKLTCAVREKSRNKTAQVSCSNELMGDIGRAMLLGGWANVSRIRSRRIQSDAGWAASYDDAEALARQNRAGFWSLKPKGQSR